MKTSGLFVNVSCRVVMYVYFSQRQAHGLVICNHQIKRQEVPSNLDSQSCDEQPEHHGDNHVVVAAGEDGFG